MPIPPFDPDGFLPAGVHDGTLEELKLRFGAFQGSDRPPKLWSKLASFVNDAKASGLVRELVVDGSFVTVKPDPDDIDLILVVPVNHDFSAELKPVEYEVLSKRRVRQKYGFDLLVAAADSEPYHRYIRFFQQIQGRRI
jgi:hypothetical protein